MDTQTAESGADSASSQNQEAAVTTEENQAYSIEDLARRFSSEAKPAKAEAAPKPEEAATEETPSTNADSAAEPEPKETQAEGDASEPEQESDEVLSQLSEKARERVNKRIGSYVYKLKTTQAELSAAKEAAAAKAKEVEAMQQQVAYVQQEYAKVANGNQRTSASDPSDPTSTINDVNSLTKLEEDAKSTIRLYERHRRAIDAAAMNRESEVEIDGKMHSISLLEDSYDLAKQLREEKIPARLKHLQVREQTIQHSWGLAKQVLPSITEPNSPEAVEARNYVASNPALREFADTPFLMACAVRGFKDWKKEQDAKAKTGDGPAKTKAVERAPNLSGGSSSPARISRDSDAPKKREAEGALSRLKSTGSTSALAQYFKASGTR